MAQHRRPPVLLLLLACCMGILGSPAPFSSAQGSASTAGAGPLPATPHLQALDLLSEQEGWILVDGQLFRTYDGGRTWDDITPGEWHGSPLSAVFFISSQTGWAVRASPAEAGRAVVSLARTDDGGDHWQLRPLSLFAPDDPDALLGSIRIGFVDSMTGWLVVRRATSSNFCVGSLFRTADGGATWTRLSIPIAEPVRFLSAQAGWTAGGAAGTELHQSLDGGQTWQPQEPAGAPDGEGRRFYALPAFAGENDGLLAAVHHAGSQTTVELYASTDSGQSWNLATAIPVDGEISPGTAVPLSPVGGGAWLVAVPDRGRLVRVLAGAEPQVVCEDPLLGGLGELDMATPEAGWARRVTGSCEPPAAGGTGPELWPEGRQSCRQETTLLRTDDGGATWRALALPQKEAESRATPEADVWLATVTKGTDAFSFELGDRTTPWIGHGFDKCEVASLSQLQTWKDSSPYGAVNLYIGGISRACPNTGLTAALVDGADAQGWVFIPTWVGPQAPCTNFTHRFSYDPATAYSQGVAEATAAVAAATDLGLALSDGTGTVLYYDLEAYNTSNSSCREAARHFIWGWTVQIKALGNHAGVYGGPCSSALSDFAENPSVPDAIWAANWAYSYYDPSATVWNLACLDNGLWANHQRLRQYTGGHNESWGGLTMNIDCDVADGIVASPRQDDGCCGCGEAGGLCGDAGCPAPPAPRPAAAPPAAPLDLGSSTHSALSWSRDPFVQVEWTIPADPVGAIAGYAIAWDQAPEGEPDPQVVLDAAANEATSGELGTGAWYAHVRAIGPSGAAGPAVHAGPFLVDVTPPRGRMAIDAGAGTELGGPVPPTFTWQPAHDEGSGVAHTLVYWGDDPQGTSEAMTGDTAFAPPAGDDPAVGELRYLRIAAVDRAGNRGDWQTLAVWRRGPAAVGASLLRPSSAGYRLVESTLLPGRGHEAVPGSRLRVAEDRTPQAAWLRGPSYQLLGTLTR